MKTELLMIGKTRQREIADLMRLYVDRVGHYMPLKLTELEAARGIAAADAARIKGLDSDRLLAGVGATDYVVLLDERGLELSSTEFARWLEKRRSVGSRRLVFMIGGAYGFSDALYRRADERLALSKMTFPHQLVRLVFLEQLYRACTIIKGEGYHH